MPFCLVKNPSKDSITCRPKSSTFFFGNPNDFLGEIKCNFSFSKICPKENSSVIQNQQLFSSEISLSPKINNFNFFFRNPTEFLHEAKCHFFSSKISPRAKLSVIQNQQLFSPEAQMTSWVKRNAIFSCQKSVQGQNHLSSKIDNFFLLKPK